jgi:hypothetical protein
MGVARLPAWPRAPSACWIRASGLRSARLGQSGELLPSEGGVVMAGQALLVHARGLEGLDGLLAAVAPGRWSGGFGRR